MGLLQEYDLEKTRIYIVDDAYREADEQLLKQRLHAYCAVVQQALQQEREAAYAE